MLTRDFLDEFLPGDEITRRLAERITGLDLSTDLLPKGLVWLADFIEKDRFNSVGDRRPEWRDRHRDTWWDISHRGLGYKTSTHYLTAEGWPMMTTCWYVCVECGFREFVAAETPELAVLRAICYVDVISRWRATEPPQRRKRHEMLAELRTSLGGH